MPSQNNSPLQQRLVTPQEISLPEIIINAFKLQSLLSSLISTSTLKSQITQLTIENEAEATQFFQNEYVREAIETIKTSKKILAAQLTNKANTFSSIKLAAFTIGCMGLIASIALTPELLHVFSNKNELEKSAQGIAGYCNPVFPLQQNIADHCGALSPNNTKTFFNLFPDPHTESPILHKLESWFAPKGWFHFIECRLDVPSSNFNNEATNLTVKMHAYHDSLKNAENYINTGGFNVMSDTKTITPNFSINDAAQEILFSLMITFCQAIGNGLYSDSRKAFSNGLQDFADTFKENTNFLANSFIGLVAASFVALAALALSKGFSFLENQSQQRNYDQYDLAIRLFNNHQPTDQNTTAQQTPALAAPTNA